MAKMTLLEMTQNILSSMDSDEVNSIGDTVESLQVAEVIKETYFDITTGIDYPGLFGLIKLDSLSDPTQPNKLKLPEAVDSIEWVRYNGKIVEYLPPEDFVRRALKSEGYDNTVLVDGIPVYTNKNPSFYTSFDDLVLFFDSFDISEDTTLQQSKTMCWGKKSYSFTMTDSFVPALPVDMFPRLLAEAKNTCFINYKQTANSNEAMKARRQLTRQQNNRYRAGTVRPIDRLPDYGRRR